MNIEREATIYGRDESDARTLERAADVLGRGHPSRGDRTVARRAQRAAVVLREMAQRLRGQGDDGS